MSGGVAWTFEWSVAHKAQSKRPPVDDGRAFCFIHGLAESPGVDRAA